MYVLHVGVSSLTLHIDQYQSTSVYAAVTDDTQEFIIYD